MVHFRSWSRGHASVRIIILNGASSSGKTSIARSLQNTLDEPFLFLSADAFLEMLPARYFGVDVSATDIAAQGVSVNKRVDAGGDYYATEFGEYGHRLAQDAMAPTIATLAAQGFNVVVDMLMLYPDWLSTYLRLLRPYEVWFVKVFCPLEVLEKREKVRGDRLVGLAKGQYPRVHANGIDDLTVDTSQLTPQEAAERVIAAIQIKPTAFDQLRAILLPDEANDSRS